MSALLLFPLWRPVTTRPQGEVGWLHCHQASGGSPDDSLDLLGTTQAGRRMNIYPITVGRGGSLSSLLNLLRYHRGDGSGVLHYSLARMGSQHPTWPLFWHGYGLGHSVLRCWTRVEQLLSRSFCIARLNLLGPLIRKSEFSWDFICACWCYQIFGFFSCKSRVNEISPPPPKRKT